MVFLWLNFQDNFKDFRKIMDTKQKTKQLMKILIGAAWVDGLIQNQERDYLHQMAKTQGIDEDPEIRPFLSELKPIQTSDCYTFLEEYLGKNPTEEDYFKLLEALSGLIYSDGDIQTPEAELLSKLQSFDPAQDSGKSPLEKMLRGVQKFYRQALNQSSL